ncbi:MAG: hypothetical protein IPK60_21815 [Sandaracinaceae bacterium]|jgi:hypothetical protein|nr:hypothetical protein [Sandaracinaceae bacterium]
MKKDELIRVLRGLLQDVLKARFAGAAHARLARAHGYADGYMRALLDTGLVSRETMLQVVGEERTRFIEDDDAKQQKQAAAREEKVSFAI